MKDAYSKPNLYICFSGTEAFLWAGMAVYYPFLVPYLKASGFNEVSIGAVTSVMSLVGIAGPIFWGMVSDRLKGMKTLLAVNLLAGSVVMQLVPAVTKNFALLLAVLVLVNGTVISQVSVIDAWIMRLKGRGAPVNYGLVRGAGSIAYALVSVAAGFILSRFGLNCIFPLMLGFQVITVFFILSVKRTPGNESGELPMLPEEEAGTPIHRNAPYIVFVLLATLLFTCVMGTLNFFWILLQDAGGTPVDLGYANCLMALSEFPVMFLSAKLLRRVKDTTLILTAMGFFAIRIFLFFSMHSVSGLIWAQLTQSMSYGLFLPASVHYICRITPGRARATALSLASSMYMGASGMVGNLLGGFVIDTLGVRALYGGSAILAAAVTVAFGAVLLFSRRQSLPVAEAGFNG